MNRRTRGRLVSPAVNSLVAAVVQPFPRVAVAQARCRGCGATAVGLAVRAGEHAVTVEHQPDCPNAGIS